MQIQIEGTLPRVVVYIRKGQAEHTRVFNFARPKTIPDKCFINVGISIDGTQCGFEIGVSQKNDEAFASYGPLATGEINLFAALAKAEQNLSALLATHGYETEYR